MHFYAGAENKRGLCISAPFTKAKPSCTLSDGWIALVSFVWHIFFGLHNASKNGSVWALVEFL